MRAVWLVWTEPVGWVGLPTGLVAFRTEEGAKREAASRNSDREIGDYQQVEIREE